MNALFAHDAWLPTGWAKNVRVAFDPNGTITAVETDSAQRGAQPTGGPLAPAMPNLHCHAFQRAMAGLAERSGAANADSFWTWRESMYGFAQRISPEDAHAIATQVYLELARSGYGSVAEFHYVHRMPDGQPYAPAAEMALAHVRAAREVGIAITLLPVVYMQSGFGGAPLEPRQARFAASPDEAFAIAQAIRAEYQDDFDVNVGIAPHSLRAVGPTALAEIVKTVDASSWRWPIHLHIAEQQREVADCTSALGFRPIEWLLDNAPVDNRWCLVHATHAQAAELARVAATGACVGLCPTTEANLGDGLFDLPSYVNAGGRFGIGSDSNVSRSPVEELRWLEYGQRLRHERRSVAASADEPHVGTRLWRDAAAGGAQALGRNSGAIAVGARADFVVLDEDRSAFAGVAAASVFDALVFSGSDELVKHTIVSGRWVIRDGRHPLGNGALTRFKRALGPLRHE